MMVTTSSYGPELLTNPLLPVNTHELLLLWGELVEAYHGVNGYGGNVAEIYSYRFQAHHPAAHNDQSLPGRHEELWDLAARMLVSLIKEFYRVYDCIVEIDGGPYKAWYQRVEEGQVVFHHRVHIRITKERHT